MSFGSAGAGEAFPNSNSIFIHIKNAWRLASRFMKGSTEHGEERRKNGNHESRAGMDRR